MIFTVIRRFFRRQQGKLAFRLSQTLLVVLVLNLVFGTAFWIAESRAQEGLSWGDGIWWAMVTMTTVGYGDFFAQTTIGRYLVSYPAFIIGIGIIGYFLGQVGEAVLDRLARQRKGFMKITDTDHLVICHCPSVDKVVQLAAQIRGMPGQASCNLVVVAASLDEKPQAFIDHRIDFVQARPTSEKGLELANVRHARGVVILARDPGNADSDAQTFAVGTIVEMIERETGHSIHTVAELVDPKSAGMMARTQVDGCIVGGGLSDRLLVQEMFNPGLRHVFDELITSSHGSQLFVLPTRLSGRPFVEVQIGYLQASEAVQLIGVQRNGDTLVNPPPKTEIAEGDQLIALAEDPKLFFAVESRLLSA